jgi:predicted nucleic acid-binding protein
MRDPSRSAGLVLDTSVSINHLATGAMGAILDALAVPCHAPEQVVCEILRHPVTDESFTADSHPHRQMGKVSVSALEGTEVELFLEIVRAPAIEALGDGEAAIALAVSRGFDLAIDDRKARRILRERFGEVRTYWTVELLQASRVVVALGRQRAEDCSPRPAAMGGCICLAERVSIQ